MKAKDLKKLSIEQLRYACTKLEIDFNEAQSKKELIALLKDSDKLETLEFSEGNQEGSESYDNASDLPEDEEFSEEKSIEKDPFEELQQDGFVLIAKIKALSNARRKQAKPTARLDSAVSQIERLIKNNFVK